MKKGNLYYKNIASLILKIYSQKINDLLHPVKSNFSTKVTEYAKEIKKNGFVVIPNYYSTDKCEIIRNQIEEHIKKKPDSIQTCATNADHRIWSIERLSQSFMEFYKDDLLMAIGECYCQTPLINYLTLGAKLQAIPNNLGSGGGWHRDSLFEKQFKAMIYLSDVEESNGPYQYIQHSNTMLNSIQLLSYVNNLKRFTEEEISTYSNNTLNRIETITGKAGTLILTDTTGIHRGMPIYKGSRFALTNYYVATHRRSSFDLYFKPHIKDFN